MRIFNIIIALALSWVVASSAPTYDGFDIVWQDTFEGPAGSLPDRSKWIMQDWYKDLNGDWQTYTTSPKNQQLTGDGSVLIIPLRDSSATKGWTSGRLESAYTFTPAPGARTIAEASIRLGSAPPSGKQGIWPAFWLLGDSHRKGTLIWPTCGEIDIMENVNGETKTQGVIHCDKNPGGICNEKDGIAGATRLADSGQDFHTYTAVIDRTPGDWRDEIVSFYLDGVQYHQVTGDRIGNEEVWGKVAHNLIHFILNVAVGGEWPGDPDQSTMDGLANAIEVEYVAHYQSTGSGGVPAYQGGESGYKNDGYGDVVEPVYPQPRPQYPPSRPHSTFPEYPMPTTSNDGEGFSILEVADHPGLYHIPGVPGFREVKGHPGLYETPDNKRHQVPELPGLREVPGRPSFYQVSGAQDSSLDYPPRHKTHTHHNFPIPEEPPRHDQSQYNSFPSPKSDSYYRPPHSSGDRYYGGSGHRESTIVGYPGGSTHADHTGSRPAPVPGRMTDADRMNQLPPMNPTRGRYGSHAEHFQETSHQAPWPPHRFQDGYSQAPESIPQYPHGAYQQSHGSSIVYCSAPSAGDPNHGTYGRPGGWGPGTGKPCPDGATSRMKARQISPPNDDEEVESKINSTSSKPGMPSRFKTPGYPPAPASDAIAPPTVTPGEYGGVQAKDKGKYLDRRTDAPGMPDRFKTPGYPPAPEENAVAPPTVTPGEYGGVEAKDKAKYLDPREVDEPAPVSSQGTPRYGISRDASVLAFVSAVVALLILF
ncbi:hypothetical protein HYE67_002132 [Fusarium culmorum]|uniref:GH16 domain-containing protein n=1 Tax=Fusarium culmorum TaxID=5516 RepID=A0A2T4GX45_FUSCU|nr:hypothetical protein FCULG_00006334 [Fusarium culmorum]QPC59901.1 hypothetical protein HYE67_002132 [Fusarium culmorum]